MKQADIIARLPAHLRPFVAEQDYAQYNARDHAVWRYIMRQLTLGLKDTAHPVYMEGLRRTGISLEHIPSIDEMNEALAQLDWQAVVVDGFIPPAIFMEFQSLKILVIALDMRSIEHILYTPAPDIVHESAGHAPFIVDIDYSEFLQRFGEIGMKAIATKQDFAVYEAIRHLSIVKEAADSTATDIGQAEQQLNAAIAAQISSSEAALLSRLHWWTVEYGLVGELDDYRIFGAGLLSSLGESRSCLDDDTVKKLPLTVDVVDYDYDITQQQPHLFVTKSCRHLSQVLEEFAQHMCFMQGGAESLKTAIASESVCTAQYDAGIQVSGCFSEVLCDAVGNEIYLRTSGPTQLAYADKQLKNHGTDYHAQGFGSPVGKLKEMHRCLSDYSVDELRNANIEIGSRCSLEFLSGVTVSGHLDHILRRDNKNILFSFSDCLVQDRHSNTLFDPSWGQYDMAVGNRISSVFGGAADRSQFDIYQQAPGSVPPRTEHTEQQELFTAYQQIRDWREQAVEEADLAAFLTKSLNNWPQEWLLHLEIFELLKGLQLAELAKEQEQHLLQLCKDETFGKLLADGLASV